MMDYTDYRYLYPPRPETKIPPILIGNQERKGYVAQTKLNGTCSVIAVSPKGEIITRGRHGSENTHKQWSITDKSAKAFHNLKLKGWTVFVAELMHSKTTNVKDTNYIFDILVHNGNFLYGTTFMERQEILQNMFELVGETDHYYIINDNTWLAKVHTSGFKTLFKTIVTEDVPEIEGLVFKKPDGKLGDCFKEKNNSGWQVKCRKPHKNYSF